MKYFRCLFLVFLLSSCQYFKPPVSRLNSDDYKIVQKDEILCFDLADDEKVKGAILVKTRRGKYDKTIILPFKTTDVENSNEILSTNSVFQNISIFSFKGSTDGQSELNAIKFLPSLNDWPESSLSENELDDGIYLNRNGLERRFVFKYAGFSKNIAKFQNATLDTIKELAVRLPEKFTGLALDSGSMYSPKPVKIFKEASLSVFESTDKPLELVKVSYMVPANKKQVALFDFLLKFIGIIIAPLIDLIFVKPSSRISIKIKRRIMWIVIIIELLIILTMGVLLLMGSIDQGKIFDFVLCLIGAAVTYFLTYIKDGASDIPPPLTS